MANFSRARRAGATAVAGRRRAAVVAERLGTGLLDARRGSGLTQAQAALRCGLSQTRFGDLERGLGVGASIETWAMAAAGVGESLAAFLEHAPGAARPRDMEHLRRQNAIIRLASSGGWTALPELAIDSGERRSRSIDVALLRADSREALVVEVWDWLDDVGAAWRSFDAKTAWLRQQHGADDWRVGGLFVVRRTRRNRRLVAELGPLFRARFRSSSLGWLRAVGDATSSIPSGDGFLWSLADGRLMPARLVTDR